MKRSILGILFSVLFPFSVSMADELIFDSGKVNDFAAPPNQVSNETYSQIQYGPTSIRFYDENIQTIALDKTKPNKNFSLFVGVAEASLESSAFLKEAFYDINKTIQSAEKIGDLRGAVSFEYFQYLGSRIKEGKDERIVLGMLQNMRPNKVTVTDASLDKDHATLLASGQSAFGMVIGRVEMVQEETGWKLAQETWVVADKSKLKDSRAIACALRGQDYISYINEDNDTSRRQLLGTPYSFKRYNMNLKKVNQTVRKNAFMFVFFMDDSRKNKKLLDIGLPFSTQRSPERTDMHILFPDLDKVMPAETVLIQRDMPLDVSIASDDEGYAEGEVNLRLPKKRPNEVTASMLWTF